MPMPKIADIRKLSDSEVSDEIMAVKRELLELRLQKATRQLEKPHMIRLAKHRLGQLMLVESERERAAATEV